MCDCCGDLLLSESPSWWTQECIFETPQLQHQNRNGSSEAVCLVEEVFKMLVPIQIPLKLTNALELLLIISPCKWLCGLHYLESKCICMPALNPPCLDNFFWNEGKANFSISHASTVLITSECNPEAISEFCTDTTIAAVSSFNCVFSLVLWCHKYYMV